MRHSTAHAAGVTVPSPRDIKKEKEENLVGLGRATGRSHSIRRLRSTSASLGGGAAEEGVAGGDEGGDGFALKHVGLAEESDKLRAQDDLDNPGGGSPMVWKLT